MPTRIVIRGLVKSQRLVEQRLAAGLLPAQADHLCAWIDQLVREVEEVCARYRMSPDSLPAPSRRAYRYLKTLAEDGLPADARKPNPPPDPVLLASFERVNRRYFGGRLARPILAWSQRKTRRELGRYVPETDLLTVSRTLAGLKIPNWVLDFIIYHELLHKHLGIRQCNGRTYSHTPEFRRAEKRYDSYAEVQTYLKALASKELSRRA